MTTYAMHLLILTMLESILDFKFEFEFFRVFYFILLRILAIRI